MMASLVLVLVVLVIVIDNHQDHRRPFHFSLAQRAEQLARMCSRRHLILVNGGRQSCLPSRFKECSADLENGNGREIHSVALVLVCE